MGQIKNIKLHIVTDIKMAVNGHAVNGALEGVSNLSISNGPAVGTKTGADYKTGTFKVKSGMAQMAKGGIIMDVVNAEQARIAENAELVPSWLWSVFRLIFVKTAGSL